MPVRTEYRQSVLVLALDNPPANALSAPIRTQLIEAVREGAGSARCEAIIITGEGRHFCAGADIGELGKPAAGVDINEVIAAIEDCSKPVVAAIGGSALGGGLELALGCHYRVADADAKFALPEAKLGFLPGAGGTQRLPRLVGAESAIRLVVSGATVTAQDAKALGLVDMIVETGGAMSGTGVVEGALDFIMRDGGGARPPLRIRDRAAPPAPAIVFDAAREAARKDSRASETSLAAIESVENAFTLPFEQALGEERRLALSCLRSDRSKALRYVFAAERAAERGAADAVVREGTEIAEAAVIGCGTMGSGIVLSFVQAGIPVRVVEDSETRLQAGLERIRRGLERRREQGKITAEESRRRFGLVSGSCRFADVGASDIAIEAVFEDMALKKRVFETLDEACRQGAILASNTSTLDIDEIAKATRRPEAVVGMHFFSPANVMRLVEIVRGRASGEQAIATTQRLAKRLGKVGVVVGVCDGFVANRMIFPYLRQANALLLEGALPGQIDSALTAFGMAMGPFAMGDLAGLDVGRQIGRRRKGRAPDPRFSAVAERLCEMNRFGQKTGAGWYRYEAGSRAPLADPLVDRLVEETSLALGYERREIADEEIVERCFYPVVNEAMRIIEEGLVQRASDLDLVWIHGFGFPRDKGGPLSMADRVGADQVCRTLGALRARQEGFAIAPLLEKAAHTGERLRDMQPRLSPVAVR